MRTTTTTTTLLFLLLLFSSFATAPLPPGTGSWVPSYLGMGITFVNAPGGGDPFTRVNGTVTNPQPLLELGFTGSLKGLKATVTPFYTAGFTMKEGGQEYAPSIVKVQLGNQYHIKLRKEVPANSFRWPMAIPMLNQVKVTGPLPMWAWELILLTHRQQEHHSPGLTVPSPTLP